LRRGDAADVVAELVAARWRRRADRGAEERVEVRERSVFVPVSALRADPHLETHKRGG
jgi:cyclic pyranopterin phosphate synthase